MLEIRATLFLLLLHARHQRGPCLRAVRLDYQLAGGGTESVQLIFRRRRDTSEWQRHACAR